MGGMEGGVEGEEGKEGEEKTSGEFVGIGGEEVVVADIGVAVEGEQENERGDGEDGGEGRGDAAEKGAEGEEGGNPESEIEGEEGMDGGASEEGEEGGVGIDGNGAEVVGEVTVEDIAARNPPREVELAGEIDEGVGPREPCGVEGKSGQDGIKKKLETKQTVAWLDHLRKSSTMEENARQTGRSTVFPKLSG